MDAGPPPGWFPSIFNLTEPTRDYVSNAPNTLGSYLIGSMVDMVLQGILSVQIVYFLSLGNAGRPLRLLTVFLATVCFFKTAQNVLICWQQIVSTFANPDLSRVLITTRWAHFTELLASAFIACIVQLFLVYRYYTLTKRPIQSVAVGAGALMSFVAAVLSTVYIPRSNFAKNRMWVIIHLSVAVGVDVLITTALGLQLALLRTTVAQDTWDLLVRLYQIALQSAFPATVVVIAQLVVYRLTPSNLRTYLAFDVVVPKLYAISLMYNLNTDGEAQLVFARASMRPHSYTFSSGHIRKRSKSGFHPTTSASSSKTGHGYATSLGKSQIDGLNLDRATQVPNTDHVYEIRKQ